MELIGPSFVVQIGHVFKGKQYHPVKWREYIVLLNFFPTFGKI